MTMRSKNQPLPSSPVLGLYNPALAGAYAGCF